MISLHRYVALLRVHGIGAAFTASIIGRLPIGIAGLAILLFVQGKSGSLAVAGGISGVYVLGLAVLAPFIGRLIDRWGPRRVLVCSALIYPSAMVALVVLVNDARHWAWTATSAALAGAFLPPITICMRALFPRVIADGSLLQTAYAVDSALIEMVFVLGPVLVGACVAAELPAAAIVFAAACAVGGSVLFLRSPLIRDWRPVHNASPRSLLGPLRYTKLLVVYGATLLYSLAFGLFEVGVTGFATQQGVPAAAAVILALASLGSAIGALSFGSHEWKASPARLYVVTQLAMGAGILMLIPVTNLYAFAILSFIGCSPMAAVLTAQSMLISRIAPRAMMAESFTWGATCLLAGISGGMSMGGVLVERSSPQGALTAAAVVTACAAIVVWTTLPQRATPVASANID